MKERGKKNHSCRREHHVTVEPRLQNQTLGTREPGSVSDLTAKFKLTVETSDTRRSGQAEKRTSGEVDKLSGIPYEC
jgi:hypothetical protein